MSIILQFILGFFYSHVLEWLLHKHILHNHKRKKYFRSHFGDHHKTSRKLWMIDMKYHQKLSFQGDPEIKGLIFLGILHLPIAVWYPWAYAALLISAVEYWWVHRRAHLDVFWARKNLSWHYDHHMGPDQHANWGVRSPIVDIVLGTRKPYKGEKKEIITYAVMKARFLEGAKNKNDRSYRNSC